MPRIYLRLSVLCAALATTTGECPFPDWVPYEGICYWVSDFTVTWDAVADVCNLAFPGSQPVSIHDLVQNAYVYENAGDGFDAYWLGLHRANAGANWTWVDGSPFDFSKWGPDQPSGDGEMCGKYGAGYEGDWYTDNCSSAHKLFMCQIDEE